MRYQGSKRSMMKSLKRLIESNLGKCKAYVEPFGGGMNAFAAVDHPNKIAADINSYVIAMWKGIQNGTFIIPESVSEIEYKSMKEDCLSKGGKYDSALLGYVGNACSNGCGWWNGYAHFNPKKNEDHIAEARRGLIKHINSFIGLDNCQFVNSDYRSLNYPDNSFIYCDPPYASTKGYNKDGFDNELFWEWCREMVDKGHKVMVSEYTAPSDFVCIWEKARKDGMGTTKTGSIQNTKVERVFVHKSQLRKFKKI